MTPGNSKEKPNHRLMRIRETTDPVREIGKQDFIFQQWWARIRRTIAKLSPEQAEHSSLEQTARSSAEQIERSPECSPAGGKPLTVTQQIYVQMQLERLDRCGFYQQPVRHGAGIDSLNQLLGLAGDEANGAKSPKPREPSED